MQLRPGIRLYLLLLFAVAAAVPVAGLGLWQSQAVASRTADDWDRALTERAQDAAVDLAAVLHARLVLVELLAAHAANQRGWGPNAEMQHLVDSHREAAAVFSIMYVADAQGRSIVTSPAVDPHGTRNAGVDYSDRPYVRTLMATGRAVVGGVTRGRRSLELNLQLAAPIHDADGRLRGFAEGSLDLARLRTAIALNTPRRDIRIVVVDPTGAVVADSAQILAALTPGPAPDLGQRHSLETARDVDQRTIVRRATATIAIGGEPWRVLASVPAEQIAAQATALHRATVWTTVAALTIAMFMVFILAAIATGPLRRLADLTVRVGEGHYESDRRLPWFAPREAQDLWGRVCDMVARLRQHRDERVALISNLEQANEQLRWLATAVEQARDGFVILDHALRIVFANPAWLRARGCTFAEVHGLNIRDVDGSGAVNDAAVLRTIDAALAAGQPWSGDLAFRVGERTTGTSEVSIAPIRGTGGSAPHHVMVIRDVTERRRAEQTQRHSERLASVGVLASGIAHEINNPMTYVAGNLEHIASIVEGDEVSASDETREELRASLMDSLEGARRVIDIVADLRTLSRVEDGDDRPAASGRQVIEGCLRIAQGQLRHRATVVRQFPAEELLLRIGERRLSQAVLNLIINAAQAMDLAGASRNRLTVELRTRSDGRGEIAVHDTGCGIPAADLRRIFDPFYTTKPVGTGTGLGLSITHSLITTAGGEVTVESTVGVGTCFRIVLPRVEPSPAARPAATAHLQGLAVLIVEDDPTVANVVARLLPDCRCTLVTSVSDALAQLERGGFDAILADVMMPGATGVDLVEALRRCDSPLAARICLMSGGVVGGLDDAVSALAVPLLKKPLARGELDVALAALLRSAAPDATRAAPNAD